MTSNSKHIYVTNLKINKFRVFEEEHCFNIGKIATAISGLNGTGKSNILGLVGNSCQYRIPNTRKSKKDSAIKRTLYSTEFGELFKSTYEDEPKNPKCCEIYFSDDDIRCGRISWQNNKKRFRIIPFSPLTKSSAKKELPVIYLGLSRLYPIGEAENIESSPDKFLSPEEKIWLFDNAKKIMSMPEEINEAHTINLNGINHKNGVGFKTEKYGPLANSSGQDNIGQILIAVLSIKKLKDLMDENYKGALLLIDEIDATLHPAAQIKLYNFLFNEARDIGFQLFFTTHSLYLLEHISQKICGNNDKRNDIELIYLTNANGKLEYHRNPDIAGIRSDLEVKLTNKTQKIKIYCEDAEARWFVHNLLDNFNFIDKVDILDHVSIGCIELLSLTKADPEYFRKTMIIFDGDATKTFDELQTKNPSLIKLYENMFTLPGSVRPEEIILNFLCDSEKSVNFYNDNPQYKFNNGYSLRNCQEKLKELKTPQAKNERDLFKIWFNENLEKFDYMNLMYFWTMANPDETNLFKDNFIKAYNKIAPLLLLKKLA
jgi:AAA15 family ATPase/GTPase